MVRGRGSGLFFSYSGIYMKFNENLFRSFQLSLTPGLPKYKTLWCVAEVGPSDYFANKISLKTFHSSLEL